MAARSYLKACLPGLSAAQVDNLVQALKEQVVHSLWNNVALAGQTADQILALAAITHNDLHRAVGLRTKAQVLMIGRGEHHKALSFYQRAQAIHARHHDDVGQALVYMTSIWAMANLGDYEGAIRNGEWASQVLAEHAQWREQATVENNLAAIHNRSWEYHRALERLERASQAYQALGETGEPFLANHHINRALALCSLGRFQEAITAGEAALTLSQKYKQTLVYARAQHTQALTYFLLSQYNRALDLLLQARTTHDEAGQPNEAALCELSITDCLLHLGRHQDALEKCQHLLPVFKTLGMRLEAAETAHNQALALVGLGQLEDAISVLGEVRALFAAEKLPHWTVHTDLEIALVYLRSGQAQTALEIASQCSHVLQGLALPYESAQAHVVAAQALIEIGDIQAAQSHLDPVLQIARQEDWPDLLYEAWQAQGRLSRKTGNRQAALEQYRAAIESLERMRGHIMLEFRADFAQDRNHIYVELVDLALEMNMPEQVLEYAERARSQAMVALLSGRADLRVHARQPGDDPLIAIIQQKTQQHQQYTRRMDYLSLDVAPRVIEELTQLQRKTLELEAQITDLWHQLLIHNADYALDASFWSAQVEPVRPYLDQQTTLVEYFTADDWIVVCTLPASQDGKPRELQALRLPASPAQVERLLQSFMLNIRSAASGMGQNAALRSNMRGILGRLYDLLLAPVADRLVEGQPLIIVPHGKLHYLPFHALHDGKQYLVERHPIRYLPASSLLRYCQGTGKAADGAVVLGHSYHGHLPHALSEASAVARLWEVEPYLEQAARSATIQAEAEQSRLLHLACHGEFRADNALFSGLALEDGWLTTLDVFNLRLRASLVTLSACQTGLSTLGGGDELTGLMRAFLAAGAASLVLSLWAVSDQATGSLMQHFYQALAAGSDKASALRQAQLRLIDTEQQSEASYSHPYFWAPFFLIGDGGSF